ncbi:MerR family DNA-binding transcriptional regulator [Streptomyces sp. S584]|uniref:MerR family DNA-binding transcriptional regulator n=1 Tax=Streptomyces sp. S584 TaxID=3096010 RepID=UPI003A4D8A6F
MRISQLAERSGVPATTLRFYEGVGLLPADRTPAGYRGVRRGRGRAAGVHRRGQAPGAATGGDR